MSTLRRLVLALGLQALGGPRGLAGRRGRRAERRHRGARPGRPCCCSSASSSSCRSGSCSCPASRRRWPTRSRRGGRFLFRVGGVAAIASLAIPRGELSAAVAAIYVVPGAARRRGIGRCGRGEPAVTSDLAASAAGIFLAIGALLFVLHRQDVAFAGLPELAVQLGAVHLHFVGFGLLLMAGALARRSAHGSAAARAACSWPARCHADRCARPHPALARRSAPVLAACWRWRGHASPCSRDPRVPAAARRLLLRVDRLRRCSSAPSAASARGAATALRRGRHRSAFGAMASRSAGCALGMRSPRSAPIASSARHARHAEAASDDSALSRGPQAHAAALSAGSGRGTASCAPAAATRRSAAAGPPRR